MDTKMKIGLGVVAAVVVFALISTDDPEKPAAEPPAVAQPKGEAIPAPVFRAMKAPDHFAMIADPRTPAAAYEKAAQAHCQGKDWCSIHAWTDEKNAATSMPMLDREAASVIFAYSLNRATGHEQSLWNCEVHKQPTASRCLAKFEPEDAS